MIEGMRPKSAWQGSVEDGVAMKPIAEAKRKPVVTKNFIEMNKKVEEAKRRSTVMAEKRKYETRYSAADVAKKLGKQAHQERANIRQKSVPMNLRELFEKEKRKDLNGVEIEDEVKVTELILTTII